MPSDPERVILRFVTILLLSAIATFLGLQRVANARQAAGTNPSIELPAELDRVLRDYEDAWARRDAAALASLFAEDGFVLAGGTSPVRGRDAIRTYYEGHGGPLSLRAFAYDVDGNLGYILGGYAGSNSSEDDGKFTLTLTRTSAGRWLIFSDMDNSNRSR